MLLLQVQAEGQEMELALQDGGSEWGPVGPEHSGQLVPLSGAEWAPGPLHQLPSAVTLHSQLLGKRSPADIVRILQTQLPLATHSARRRDAALDLTISGLFHLLCQPITLIF